VVRLTKGVRQLMSATEKRPPRLLAVVIRVERCRSRGGEMDQARPVAAGNGRGGSDSIEESARPAQWQQARDHQNRECLVDAASRAEMGAWRKKVRSMPFPVIEKTHPAKAATRATGGFKPGGKADRCWSRRVGSFTPCASFPRRFSASNTGGPVRGGRWGLPGDSGFDSARRGMIDLGEGRPAGKGAGGWLVGRSAPQSCARIPGGRPAAGRDHAR